MQPNYLKLDPKPAHRLLSRCMMGNVMTPKIPSWRADQLPGSYSASNIECYSYSSPALHTLLRESVLV